MIPQSAPPNNGGVRSLGGAPPPGSIGSSKSKLPSGPVQSPPQAWRGLRNTSRHSAASCPTRRNPVPANPSYTAGGIGAPDPTNPARRLPPTSGGPANSEARIHWRSDQLHGCSTQSRSCRTTRPNRAGLPSCGGDSGRRGGEKKAGIPRPPSAPPTPASPVRTPADTPSPPPRSPDHAAHTGPASPSPAKPFPFRCCRPTSRGTSGSATESPAPRLPPGNSRARGNPLAPWHRRS